MRFRILLSSLFLLLTLGSASAHTKLGEADPSWKVCNADRDCVEINTPCGSTAVNKRFEMQAQDFYLSNAYQQLDCKDKPVDPHRRIICDLTLPCDDSPTGLCPAKKGLCKVLHPDQK